MAAAAHIATYRGEGFKHGAIQALLWLNAVIMVYPLLVMIMSSFKTNAEIFTSPLALPQSPSFDNLEKVWTETNFLQYLANSLFVTTSSVVLILIVSTMAAYAIARYEFRHSGLVLMFFLSGMTVPLKLAIIPLFLQLNAFGLLNTYLGLILITSDSLKTLPQGLTVFMGEFVTDWGVLFTGLTLAALPVTILYILLSKQFIAGLTQGAIK